MTAQLSPTPVFRAQDNNNRPLFGGQLFTYAAGTTTPQATYVDSTQTTQNPNPVILNSRGECNLWLDPLLSYKFVLEDSSGNQIWSVDNIQGQLGAGANIVPTADDQFNIGSASFRFANGYFGTQIYVGASNTPVINDGVIGYWPQTAAEIAAGVIPTNYFYPERDVRRYGTNSSPGTTDMTSAFTSGLAVCKAAVPSGTNVNWGAVCVTVPASQKFAVTSVSIPSGCGLICQDGVAAIIALSNSVGAVLDTPVVNSGNTAIFDIVLQNIYVHGPGNTGTVCGLRLNNCQSPTLQNIFFDNLPGPALVVNSKADGTAYYYGVATSLTGSSTSQGIYAAQVLAFNCLQNATALTQRVGAFNIMGSDQDFYSCAAWNPLSRSLSSSNKYAPAWALVGVNESRFINCKGSVSDQGWYVDASTSANFFTNLRADSNFAEGIDIAGSSNWFEQVDCNGNGQATNNTYDQIVFEVGAERNYIGSGICSNNLGAANAPRYSVTDKNTVVAVPNRLGLGLVMKDAVTGGINNSGGVISVTLPDGAPQALTANSATPAVVNGNQPIRNWITANTAATSITNFTGAYVGQVLYVESGDSNTTIVFNSALIRTLSGANITPGIFAPGHICGFKLNPNGYWQQFCG